MSSSYVPEIKIFSRNFVEVELIFICRLHPVFYFDTMIFQYPKFTFIFLRNEKLKLPANVLLKNFTDFWSDLTRISDTEDELHKIICNTDFFLPCNRNVGILLILRFAVKMSI